MVPKSVSSERDEARKREKIAYIRQMLAELHQVAQKEGAEMLCYLLEMAYAEAGDIQAGRRALSINHPQRN